jgi:hypothetical protein
MDSADGDAARLDHLILWPQFSGPEWQLPVSGIPGERLLVGWKVVPEMVDAGPPLAAAKVLATVLFRHARLTFPSAIRAPVAAGLLPRKWRLNRHFQWSTAASAKDACQSIFYADSFSWSLQSQVVILSQAVAPLPNPLPLDERHLHLRSEPGLFGELAEAGALGVMLPGVDGDVAGLYFFTSDLARVVRDDLDSEARKTGARCAVATDETFRRFLRQAALT